MLELADADLANAVERVTALRRLAMVEFAKAVLPAPTDIQVMLAAAAPGPRPVAALIQALPEARRALGLRGLAWLLKLGVLRVCPPRLSSA